MKAYTYKHKKTGARLQTDKPLSEKLAKQYVLVTRVQNGQMKGAHIQQK
jgi:hypothetical protein